MDPFRLLSRSTRLRGTSTTQKGLTPSSGQNAPPQLFAQSSSGGLRINPRKRKRCHTTSASLDTESGGLDYFGDPTKSQAIRGSAEDQKLDSDDQNNDTDPKLNDTGISSVANSDLSLENKKAILRQHKLKVTWINPTVLKKKERQKVGASKTDKVHLFPRPLQSFDELGPHYGISNTMAANIKDQGYSMPTEIQLGALPLLLSPPSNHFDSYSDLDHIIPDHHEDMDLLAVAPTGSGKTLAFMIPLIHKTQKSRHKHPNKARSASSIILAPTKELVGQLVNEGKKLAIGTGVRITQLQKYMQLVQMGQNGQDDHEGKATKHPVVKADIMVCTPGTLHSILEHHKTSAEALSNVQHLVLDEADVLLDPLFREQTLHIWTSLANDRLRVSLWSATMGSNIEELARSTISNRRKMLSAAGGTEVHEAPLIRLVVGLKDSAVSNVDHKLVYAATEQGKLMGLRQFLRPTATSKESELTLRPPFLIFTQTIERAIALHSELLYDIPAEAGGVSRIAVLHSDLSDAARDNVMTRFRKGEIWILITTDLLSRGIDFRGINGVVNYDIPTSAAAYVHRVGRTGRAGRIGGVAVTLYSKEDIPFLKPVANVVAMAQKQNGGSQDGGVDQWLLDALPRLSKQAKHRLKKRGVESRMARGNGADSKAARKARISSKAGYVRRLENKRKGAVISSKLRMHTRGDADSGDETEFLGFD
ncbi:hypothetical protein M433DRAFT_75318 [Acidomyces richmondensis BFW]|nr:MAG: hypothetical protein FE78DRAFT_142202 [Acidomyces sp. 'richmondensis']KYG41707.1 hypothetical protein M433DRAFT_75318 [Acidomyces richmondensis BFW]